MNVPGQALAAALQRGLPLEPRPFAALAAELGCTEADVLAEVARLRAAGHVRRFGAVFDTRRLGYTSVLCAVRVPVEGLDAAAAAVTPHVGVTHCYVREKFDCVRCTPAPSDFPNLWFTLSCPQETFAAEAAEVRSCLAPGAVRFLPATRRYKVDVVFGAASRAREEQVDDPAPPTAEERAVIRVLQGDTEVRSDYFAALAARAGCTEWHLLAKLEMWRRSGRLKRVGLLLAHRAAGWTANGMCCWSVPGDTMAPGRALAACGEVTHCYARPPASDFPYNLFAMVHARTAADAVEQFRRLEKTTGLTDGVMLISTREYKKTSMTFFADA